MSCAKRRGSRLPGLVQGLILCAVTYGMGCANLSFEKEAPGDPFTAEGIALQVVLGNLATPAFRSAHDYIAASAYCQNNIEIPGLSSDAACTADANCTVSTSRCTAASAVGVCTTRPLGAVYERVYYSPTYNASSAQSDCSSTLKGSFSTSYTQ